MKDRIIAATDSPHELEKLYRAGPEAFSRSFPAAFADRSDATVLQVWQERLFFQEGETVPKASPPSQPSWDIWVTVLLSFLAGTLVKLPQWFSWLDDERLYSRNLGSIMIGSLIAFFCLLKPLRKRTAGIISAVLIGSILYLNLLPADADSQPLILSCLHMPFFFWSLLGITFLGGVWNNPAGRMDYVRYNGELLIYTTIILIGGMVLTGVTGMLFTMINLDDFMEWYMQNVVVYGMVASPIVATLLVERIVGNRFKLAPLFAKVFTPLFLLTLVIYLCTMLLDVRSLFTDRDFLIAFNVLLLVVLGICILSISERGTGETAVTVDFMNIMLVSVTLVIDLIAFAAILFRLSSYGFTPNRIAVLGANLLAFGHLAGILWYYIRFTGQKTGIDRLERWIVLYIPAYTAWSLIVSVGFPLLFWFT